MGAASSRTDRRIPTRPRVIGVGDYAAFACVCREKLTSVIEEKKRPSSAESAQAEEDLLFVLTYKRTKPRTICTKILFGLHYFFLDLCPTICCPPCPDAIIHKLAFRPPERPTYDIASFGENCHRIHLKSAAIEYLRLRYRRCQAYPAQLRCFYVTSRSGGRIACIYAKSFAPSSGKRPLTLLYSHNNGIDLGLSIGYIILTARRFRVDVFAYDYAGYGRSGGQCSEPNLYRSAEAAYEFLTKDLGLPGNEIVAIGTSLGTAATIHLASTNRPLRGIILQGGFLSALRIVCPMRQRTCRMDRFVNLEKIERVQCPTLVVHGRNDKLFSVAHAEKLTRLCPGAKRISPLLLDDCGHLEFDDFPAYWQRIHKFLHMELTPSDQNGPCCTYHPTEMARRQRNKAAAMSATSSPRG